MASNSSSNGQIKLKLMVDKKGQRVIMAEAEKDFVDFLFNISYLPLGTVMTELLAKGCLGNIYKSVEEYGDRISSQRKDDIVTPKVVIIYRSKDTDPNLALTRIQTSTSTEFRLCTCNGSYHSRIARKQGALCSKCLSFGKLVDVQGTGTSSDEGYVKSNEKYMVMDDLVVRLKSDFCFFTFFQNYDIKNIAMVEAREVCLGEDEALKLLKASMDSETVLTDVFLRNQDSKVSTFK